MWGPKRSPPRVTWWLGGVWGRVRPRGHLLSPFQGGFEQAARGGEAEILCGRGGMAQPAAARGARGKRDTGWGGGSGGVRASPELTDEGLALVRGAQPVAAGEEGVGVGLVEPGQVPQGEAQPLLRREGWQHPKKLLHPPI